MSLLSSLLNPRAVRSFGVTRALHGLRTGSQSTLLTGAALALIGWLRARPRGGRELLTRKVVPLGSTVIIRHAAQGSELPTIEVTQENEHQVT